jgi:drug/metabolite transporter (DMT)-like permease
LTKDGIARDDPARGVLYVLGAAAAFSTMSALIKSASGDLSTEMLVFLRNAFSLLFLLPFLARLRIEGLRTKVFHLHLLRATFGVTGIYLFVYAITHLPLAEGVLLNHTSALFVPFIAFLWLGERLSGVVGIALVIGFVGIALILKPGGDFRSFGTLVGLASGLTTAFAVVTIRRNAQTEPYQRIVFYFFTLATLVSAVPAALYWQAPTPRQWLMLGAAGLFATLGQLGATKAYALAPATRIGPYTYVSVVFAAAWGWALWGEAPDLLSIGGAVLIAIGGALALPRSVVTPRTPPAA